MLHNNFWSTINLGKSSLHYRKGNFCCWDLYVYTGSRLSVIKLLSAYEFYNSYNFYCTQTTTYMSILANKTLVVMSISFNFVNTYWFSWFWTDLYFHADLPWAVNHSLWNVIWPDFWLNLRINIKSFQLYITTLLSLFCK